MVFCITPGHFQERVPGEFRVVESRNPGVAHHVCGVCLPQKVAEMAQWAVVEDQQFVLVARLREAGIDRG